MRIHESGRIGQEKLKRPNVNGYLTTTWVLTKKEGIKKSRLCSRVFEDPDLGTLIKVSSACSNLCCSGCCSVTGMNTRSHGHRYSVSSRKEIKSQCLGGTTKTGTTRQKWSLKIESLCIWTCGCLSFVIRTVIINFKLVPPNELLNGWEELKIR